MFTQDDMKEVRVAPIAIDVPKIKLRCICGRSMKRLHTCKRGESLGEFSGLGTGLDYMWVERYFQKDSKDSEWGEWIQDTLNMEVSYSL